jgi:hypothetical protein
MGWTRSAVAAVGAVLALAVLPAAAEAAHADFAVTLSGPSEASVGGRAAYEIELTNAGPDKEPAKLRFTRGHGAADVDHGEAVRIFSQTITQGTCGQDTLGIICRPGAIAAGETVKVEVVMKVFTSDLPKLAVQATVAPEQVPGVDTNNANDHAETSTVVREPIAVDGLPGNCATQPFKLSVQIEVPKAKRTKVIVDGRVLEASGKSKLTVTVKPSDLHKGSHQLSIVVQGSGPPLATLKRKFKTC